MAARPPQPLVAEQPPGMAAEVGTHARGLDEMRVKRRSGEVTAIARNDVIEARLQAPRLGAQSVGFGGVDRGIKTFLDLAQIAVRTARLVHFVINLLAAPLERF